MANIWVYTGGFCKFELSILQVEFVISQHGGDSATWRWFATCFVAWRWFRSYETPCEISQVDFISQLRNFRTAWCSCLQTTITSLFQLQLVYCLKRWTPDLLIFETTYSMHEMDYRKYSKYVQQLLSSWILHVRFLCFSSLHYWLALAKNYEAPKLGFFM